MMGGWSPIHFRSVAGVVTLICVVLSYFSCNGLSYWLGYKTAALHNIMPFMLLGVGVDDMFVISSQVDQTDQRATIEERMGEAMAHAGSSITITSLTNAIALFLGCTTSLEAVRSFCVFAGIGIIMLFLSSITIFSTYMVYDLHRQHS